MHQHRLNAGLNVIARKEAGDAIHYAFPPSIVVLLQHVQDGALLEAQLIVFVSIIIVNGDHCNE